jgi:hypothetical protein
VNDENVFIDKEGRELTIFVDSDAVVAKHNGVEIGRLELFEDRDGFDQFTGVHLVHQIHIWKEEYRRAGTGRELYRLAFEAYGKLGVADQDPMSKNAPTTEGAYLLNEVIRLGYVIPFYREKPDWDDE